MDLFRISGLGFSVRRLLLLVCECRIIDLLGDELQLGRTATLDGAVEAGLVTDVALAFVHSDLQDQAVLVAVYQDLADGLDVPLSSPFFQSFLRERL